MPLKSMANYDKFRSMAYKFCAKHRRLDLVDDCVNQVYIDFSLYAFKDTLTMYWDIKYSFLRACLFARDCVSLETPLSDEDGGTFGDIIADNSPTAQERIEMRETITESAPKIFSLLREIFNREQRRQGVLTEKNIKTLVEYIFPTYRYEEIRRLAGV